MLNFLARLGVVEGMTFRVRIEDGVGPILEPNPRITRMHPQAVELSGAPEVTLTGTGRRFHTVSGRWVAKPLHLSW